LKSAGRSGPARTATGSPARSVIAKLDDNVIPQVVDGAGWQTSFSFVNLDTVAIKFELYFISDTGDDLTLYIPGVGSTAALTITLPVNESISFSTPGTKSGLSQGYGYIVRDDATYALGGFAVFRQQVSGRPDFEAVVPFASELDTHFVLLYDNTNNYATSFALANPSSDTIVVTATVRDDLGTQLASTQTTLSGWVHQAYGVAAKWPATAGKRGAIEFTTTGWGAAALGLRFNPGGAFTSFHVLSSPSW
jgi:hypothetical protein